VISSSPRLWVFGEGETLRVYTGLCKNDALDLDAVDGGSLYAVLEEVKPCPSHREKKDLAAVLEGSSSPRRSQRELLYAA